MTVPVSALFEMMARSSGVMSAAKRSVLPHRPTLLTVGVAIAVEAAFIIKTTSHACPPGGCRRKPVEHQQRVDVPVIVTSAREKAKQHRADASRA